MVSKNERCIFVHLSQVENKECIIYCTELLYTWALVAWNCQHLYLKSAIHLTLSLTRFGIPCPESWNLPQFFGGFKMVLPLAMPRFWIPCMQLFLQNSGWGRQSLSRRASFKTCTPWAQYFWLSTKSTMPLVFLSNDEPSSFLRARNS